METCYVTFGQKYRTEPHPIDERAHPDGWFEFVAETYDEAERMAYKYFLDEKLGLAAFAFTYSADTHEPHWYSQGCLARITKTKES